LVSTSLGGYVACTPDLSHTVCPAMPAFVCPLGCRRDGTVREMVSTRDAMQLCEDAHDRVPGEPCATNDDCTPATQPLVCDVDARVCVRDPLAPPTDPDGGCTVACVDGGM